MRGPSKDSSDNSDVEQPSSRADLISMPLSPSALTPPPLPVETDLEKQSVRGEIAGFSSDDTEGPKMNDAQLERREDEIAGQGQSDGENGGGLSKVVSRVLSKVSTKTGDIGPPPDGGMRAWMAVASAHLVVMNTWGIINSFGLFQTYYTARLPSHTPSDISWIGSLDIFLLFFVGALTGRATDAGYFRLVYCIGVALQIVGIFTASVAKTYWQLLLAQGVCVGLGNGFLFCPCISTVSTYFAKRRGLAIAMVATGSATGGLIFPGIVRAMVKGEDGEGFVQAVRAIGYVQIATFVAAGLGLKQRVPPRRTGPLIDWEAFLDGEYTLYTVGSFLFFLGLYFAFYYIASFSRDIIGLSYTDSLNLLMVMNAVGYPGRLLPNHIADRVGTLNMLVPVTGIAGICMLCWMAVKSTTGLYVWCIFYGTVAGGIQSLFPAGASRLTTDLQKAGVRMGMIFTIVSFATLAGPPIAGAIVKSCGGKYYGAQAFAGAAILLGMGFLAAAREIKVRREMREKGLEGRWGIKV